MSTQFGPMGEIRITPALPAHAMSSYELHQPLATHYRVVSCQAIECPKYHSGWQMGYDLTDPRKVEAANLLAEIARKRGMVFSYQTLGTVVTFTFQPGQNCFETHREPLERDPIAIRRNGDWRGNPRKESYTHTDLEDWVADFQTNQDKLATRLEQGSCLPCK